MSFIEDLIPSNPLFFLYYLAGVTLISLLLIYFFSKKAKKTDKKDTPEITMPLLLKIAKNPKSTQKDLLSALILYNENFSVEKTPESLDFFKMVLNHKNRNKALFDYFHGKVLPKNLKFKNKLDRIEKEALNRGGD